MPHAAEVGGTRRQIRHTFQANQGGGDLAIDISDLADDLLQLTYLALQRLLLLLQLLEDRRHGAELLRPFRKAQVLAGALALGSHCCQGRLLGA